MYLFLILCSLVMPITMIMLGRAWTKNPPKDRNGMSGYRTTMSRLNEDTWRYAHRCWGKLNFYAGVALLFSTCIVAFIIRNRNDLERLIMDIVWMQIGLFMLTMVPVEIQLHRVFDKNGHRRKKE